ncbi:MAG: 30S ribosome-binding factor RbfA [Bacteroidota bacterium]
MSNFRLERLGETIKRDLGDIIQRSFQPEGTFVTITKVRLTPDLSIAKVYVSVFAPGRDERQVFEYLDEQVPAIRHRLAAIIKNQVRKIPELHFYADDTSEYIDNMERLFRKVDESPKASPEEDSDDA